MALSDETIWKAADTLVEAGIKPTLVAVRKELGGFGSWDTITAATVEWRTQQAIVQVHASEPLPALISDRLMRVGNDIWACAQETATARLDSERAALEAASALHDAGRREAAALADQLTADIDGLQASKHALERTLAATQGDLVQAQRELAVAEARIGELQQQVTQALAGERSAIADAAELRGRLQALSPIPVASRPRRHAS